MAEYKVSLAKAQVNSYPTNPPFRPNVNYPECPFHDYSEQPNKVYDLVRESFRLLRLDEENFGSAKWNPLRNYVHPDDFVVLKPNLVLDINRKDNNLDCMITHPSVVAAVLDYVVIALQGKGKIVVGDAPVQECDFDNLVNKFGYSSLIDYYKKTLPSSISIDLKDFRGVKSVNEHGIKKYTDTGEKGVVVNLGEHSLFYGMPESKLSDLRITNYDPNILKQHHNSKKQEYSINPDILKADVIINMPKPKTHRKAGLTISLKNMIGANSRKEFLPHHTNGSLKDGGDSYKDKSFFKKMMNKCLDKLNFYSQGQNKAAKAKIFYCLYRFFQICSKILDRKDKYFEGSWYGNSTINKTIIDVNRAILYADKNGVINSYGQSQRRMFIVADMIVSGEKEGPLSPSPKDVGIIAVGDNQVAFDSVISKLAGIKPDYYNTLKEALKCDSELPLYNSDNFRVSSVSNYEPFNKMNYSDISPSDLLYFEPSSGWVDAFLTKPNGQ